MVKSDDRVVVPLPNQLHLLGAPLAARKDELRNVTFHPATPSQVCFGLFYELGMEKAFCNTVELFYGNFARTAPVGDDAKRTIYLPGIFSCLMKSFDERLKEYPFAIDAAMVTASPPDKVTVSGFSGCDGEDFQIIDNNPAFEQCDSKYVLDIRNASRNDNFVAVNNAISVDLTG